MISGWQRAGCALLCVVCYDKWNLLSLLILYPICFYQFWTHLNFQTFSCIFQLMYVQFGQSMGCVFVVFGFLMCGFCQGSFFELSLLRTSIVSAFA